MAVRDDARVATPSPRLAARVRRDFGDPVADEVLADLQQVPEELAGGSGLDPERLQAALVLTARGDRAEVDARLELARLDWRDALVAAGLADGDWPRTLDRELGPASTTGSSAPGRSRGRVRSAVGVLLAVLLACTALGLAVVGEVALVDGRWVPAVLLYGGAAVVIALMTRGRPRRRGRGRPPPG